MPTLWHTSTVDTGVLSTFATCSVVKKREGCGGRRMNIDREKLRATKSRKIAGRDGELIERKDIHSLLHTSTSLTSLLIRANVTANQTTLISCVFGLLGVLALWAEFKFLSILFTYLHWTLDYSDGWIARYTGTASDFGTWLDTINHVVVTTFLFVTIANMTDQDSFCWLTVFVFLISIFDRSHDANLLGGSYRKISILMPPALVLELSLYFSIIFNRFEVVTVTYLLIWGSTYVLSVISRIKQWREVSL